MPAVKFRDVRFGTNLTKKQVDEFLDKEKMSVAQAAKNVSISDDSYVFKRIQGRARLVHVDRSFVVDGVVTSKKQAMQRIKESKYTNVKHARKEVKMPKGYTMDKANKRGTVRLRKQTKDELAAEERKAAKGKFVEARLDLWNREEKTKSNHSNKRDINGVECYLQKEYDIIVPASMLAQGDITVEDESDFNSLINALKSHPTLGDNQPALFWMADGVNEEYIYAATVSGVSDHAPRESYSYGAEKFARAFANRASCSRFTCTFLDPSATSFESMYYSETSREHHKLCGYRYKNKEVAFDQLRDGQCALNTLILNGESTRKVYADEKHSRIKRKRPEEVVPAGPATLMQLADFQRSRRQKLLVLNAEENVPVYFYHPAMDGKEQDDHAKTLALYAADNHLTLADSYSVFRAFRWDDESLTFVRRKKEEEKADRQFPFVQRCKAHQKRTLPGHAALARPYFANPRGTAREQLDDVVFLMQSIVYRPEKRDMYNGELQKSHRIVVDATTVKEHVWELLQAGITPASSSQSRFTLVHGDIFFNIEAGNTVSDEATTLYGDEHQFRLMEDVRRTVGLNLMPRNMISVMDPDVRATIRELAPSANCRIICEYEGAPEKQPIVWEADICKSHPSMLREIGGIMATTPLSRFRWIDAGVPLKDKAFYIVSWYTDVPLIYADSKVSLHYGLYLKRQQRRGGDWEAVAVLDMTEFSPLANLDNLFDHVYNNEDLDPVLRKFVFNEAIGKMGKDFNRYYKAHPYRSHEEAHAARDLLGSGKVAPRSVETADGTCDGTAVRKYWEVAQTDEAELYGTFMLNRLAIVDGQNCRVQQMDEAWAIVLKDFPELRISACYGADAWKACHAPGQEEMFAQAAAEVQRRFAHLFVKPGMSTREEMGLFKVLLHPVTAVKKVARTMRGSRLALKDNRSSHVQPAWVSEEDSKDPEPPLVEVPNGYLETLPIDGEVQWTDISIQSEESFDDNPQAFNEEVTQAMDRCLRTSRGVQLRGPPGTGKSFAWEQYCPRDTTVVFCPTHELRERQQAKGANALTINAFKKVKNFADIPKDDGFITVDIDPEDGVPTQIDGAITHVVLEEFGLFTDYQWRCAMALRKHHPDVRIIMVGDPRQELPCEDKLNNLSWSERLAYYDRAAARVAANNRIWLKLDKRVCKEDRDLKHRLSEAIWEARSLKALCQSKLWRAAVPFLTDIKELPTNEGGSHCTFLRATLMGICAAVLRREGRSYGFEVGDIVRNRGGNRGHGAMPQNSMWKVIAKSEADGKVQYTLEKQGVAPVVGKKETDKAFLTPEGHRVEEQAAMLSTFRHTYATTTFGQQGGSQRWNSVWDLDNPYLQKDDRWRHTLYNALGRLTSVRATKNEDGVYTSGMFIFAPGLHAAAVTAEGYRLLGVPDCDNREVWKKIRSARSDDEKPKKGTARPWNLWSERDWIDGQSVVERFEKQLGSCAGRDCGAELYGTDWEIDRPDCTRPHLKSNMQLLCRDCNRAKSPAERDI